MKQLIVSAVAILIAIAPASAQQAAAASHASSGEQAVLAVAHKVTDAVRHNSADELGPLLADDYYYVGTRGNVLDKRGQLASFKDGLTKVESLSTSDERVRMMNDAAVVTLVRHQKGRHAGGPMAGEVRVIHVYERRHGRWLLVASQQTAVQR